MKKVQPAEKPVKLKEKIKLKSELIKDFLNSVYLGEKTYSTVSGKVINFVKVFIIATRKFLMDDCLTKASSIAYTTIVSLIPTLTVGLTFYSLYKDSSNNKEELFRNISIFLIEHNIKLNIDPIFTAISELIDNAGKIGGIGAVILVFSATAMLRSLESSLNDIWKVKKSRPVFLKIIYYWAALTLGPIMLIAGTTVATQVSEFFSTANYNSGYVSEKNFWAVGNKSSILQSPADKIHFQKINEEKIDFDNQRFFLYDNSLKTFSEQDSRVDPLEFKKNKFNDIQFIGKNGWVVGNEGIILNTTDSGATWNISKWGNFNLNTIKMISEERGFIACDSGLFLYTDDSGKNWKSREWEGVTSNLNSIAFNKKRGIITGNRGMIFTTTDSGKTWKQTLIKEARRKDRPVNLNAVQFINDSTIWISGDEGILLRSDDNGETWKQIKFRENNYYALYFFDKNRGFAAGEKGVIISTADGGENWTLKDLPTYKINKLEYKNKKLWAFGDSGMLMTSGDMGKSWHGTEGKSFVAVVLNFAAPFVFIWFLFLLAYITMPNTKVPFKYAAIGASFTGSVWVIFILLFIVYVKAFAKGTFAVYGTLAAIPLFLLMVYASSLIVLYGAEVAYTLMHPESYRNLRNAFREKKDIYVYYGLAILHHIYAKFESGAGSSEFKDLLKTCANSSEQVDFFTKLFQDKNLIMQKHDGGYIPTNSSENISIAEVIEEIHAISLELPSAHKSKLKETLAAIFGSAAKIRKQVIGDMTLKHLIDKAK